LEFDSSWYNLYRVVAWTSEIVLPSSWESNASHWLVQHLQEVWRVLGFHWVRNHVWIICFSLPVSIADGHVVPYNGPTLWHILVLDFLEHMVGHLLILLWSDTWHGRWVLVSFLMWSPKPTCCRFVI
jgi:hypothetical protein